MVREEQEEEEVDMLSEVLLLLPILIQAMYVGGNFLKCLCKIVSFVVSGWDKARLFKYVF